MRRLKLQSIQNENGFILLVGFFIMAALVALAFGASQMAAINFEISQAHKQGKKAYYSAEVGLELAVNDILSEFAGMGVYSESIDDEKADSDGFITVPDYQGYEVNYRIDNPLEPYLYQTVYNNSLVHHYAHTYDIESEALSLENGSQKNLLETVRILETPLVQFFAFYGGTGNVADLEFHPGPPMNAWGRIHSNGNIYIGANRELNLMNFDEDGNLTTHSISAAGNIYFKKKSNLQKPRGVVTIKTSDTGDTFSPVERLDKDITPENMDAETLRFNKHVNINVKKLSSISQIHFKRNGYYEES